MKAQRSSIFNSFKHQVKIQNMNSFQNVGRLPCDMKTFHDNSEVKWIPFCLTLLIQYEITLHFSRPLLETMTGYFLLMLSIHAENNVFI